MHICIGIICELHKLNIELLFVMNAYNDIFHYVIVTFHIIIIIDFIEFIHFTDLQLI